MSVRGDWSPWTRKFRVRKNSLASLDTLVPQIFHRGKRFFFLYIDIKAYIYTRIASCPTRTLVVNVIIFYSPYAIPFPRKMVTEHTSSRSLHSRFFSDDDTTAIEFSLSLSISSVDRRETRLPSSLGRKIITSVLFARIDNARWRELPTCAFHYLACYAVEISCPLGYCRTIIKAKVVYDNGWKIACS